MAKTYTPLINEGQYNTEIDDRKNRGRSQPDHPYSQNHQMYVEAIQQHLNGINKHLAEHVASIRNMRPSGNDVDRMRHLYSYLGAAHDFIKSGKPIG